MLTMVKDISSNSASVALGALELLVPGALTGIAIPGEDLAVVDDYFDVKRVTSADPVWSLAQSLVRSAVAVSDLARRVDQLDRLDLELQLSGFAEYAELLSDLASASVQSQ